MGTRCPFLVVKCWRGVTVNTHTHQVMRSRMSRSYNSSSLGACMVFSGTALVYVTLFLPYKTIAMVLQHLVLKSIYWNAASMHEVISEMQKRFPNIWSPFRNTNMLHQYLTFYQEMDNALRMFHLLQMARHYLQTGVARPRHISASVLHP
jgi:hypothetical protein